MLAESLLDGAKMFNHHRGLWGYTGRALDGEPLTIQSTGMGGPSAAIVIHELIDLGARRLLRVGTCGALPTALRLGDLVIATEAIAADGTSRALGAGDRVPATPGLLAAVADGATPVAAPVTVHQGPVVTTDLFYDARGLERLAAAGALAVEMEAATLFALAAPRGRGGRARSSCQTSSSPSASGSARRNSARRAADGPGRATGAQPRVPGSGRSALRRPLGDRRLDPRQLLLDRGQTLVHRARRAELVDPLLDPVEAVLDRLEPL